MKNKEDFSLKNKANKNQIQKWYKAITTKCNFSKYPENRRRKYNNVRKIKF